MGSLLCYSDWERENTLPVSTGLPTWIDVSSIAWTPGSGHGTSGIMKKPGSIAKSLSRTGVSWSATVFHSIITAQWNLIEFSSKSCIFTGWCTHASWVLAFRELTQGQNEEGKKRWVLCVCGCMQTSFPLDLILIS